MTANQRPTEWTAALLATVTAILTILGASAQVIGIAGTLAGAIPVLVTAIVANGGLQGLARRVWFGRRA